MATVTVTQGFVQTSGTRLYYEMAGQGEPLVLIHARLLHSGQWDEQFLTFAERYRVIRYDVRGFGQSRMDIFGSDVEDLRVLLDHFDLPQAHLLGLSMGAEIALNFALDYPDRVRSLELISPGLDGYEYSEQAMLDWQKFIHPLMRRDFATALQVFSDTWVDGPVTQAHPAVHDRVRELMRGYDFAHYFPGDREDELTQIIKPPAENMYISTADLLHEINVPVLVMTGDNDQPDVIKIGKFLENKINRAQLTTVYGAGHLINLQQPKMFNMLVLEFLNHLR